MLLLALAVQFNIQEIMWDFGLNGTQCAGASVPALGYNGILPGPIINRVQCAHYCTFVHLVLLAIGTKSLYLLVPRWTCVCPPPATDPLHVAWMINPSTSMCACAGAFRM
jgi:hypothetical protein